MNAKLQEHVAFHLTGKRVGAGLDAPERLGLRPALLAPYQDLAALRYDYPLVLVQADAAGACARSLSSIIDGLLQEIAPRGIEGERTRKHVLKLEREIRRLAAGGVVESLSTIWDKAAKSLARKADKALTDDLARARAALEVDGELTDCDPAMPARFLTHMWRVLQRTKTRAFQAEIERLAVKLAEVLRGDFIRSDAGRSAASLRASFGTSREEAFDFEALSRLLTSAAPQASLPESRRRRIESALKTLKSQRFFRSPGDVRKQHSFVFDGCADALAAYRKQLPDMVELVKAVAIAELEIEGNYIESHHDLYFEEFDANVLRPQDLNLFPGYLVCIRAGGEGQAADNAGLMEVLSLGLPVKVLVQIDDILEEPAVGDGHFAFSARGARLASMAIGLHEVYVVQSSSSNLYQLRSRILKGLEYPGRALFSVYTGGSRRAAGLPPYLVAAAAMQSRAFPAFTYDPSAGTDWASRFTLEDNPQAELDWPVARFTYEDEARQRINEELAFTFVDFVACDPRYAKHLAGVPRAHWNGSLIAVKECLNGDAGLPERVPYLMMVDRDNVLRKVIVDDKLVAAAQRCREMWHSFQELGGIRNSYAERLLAREKKAWEEEKQREIEALKRDARASAPVPVAGPPPVPAATTASAPVPTAALALAAAPESAPPLVEEKRSDEAYIETPRCTTCNECTLVNDRMFAYDENKQAYIKDPDAGSYRQLVDAAESCQVSIIHPGKPRNPNEPGLEELLKRAEPFL